MLTKYFVERVLRVREQFEELGLPAPRDRMSSDYYNLVRKQKKVYIPTSEGIILRFKTRNGRALEKRVNN